MKPKDLLAVVLVSFVGLSACGATPPAGTEAGGVGKVQDALDALRRAGAATFSATYVHKFLDSDEPREVRYEYGGTYQADGGPWGETVHIQIETPGDEGPRTLHRWDLGDTTVMPNFVFERDEEDPPPLPWRAFPEQSEQRNPSLLTAFALIGEATEGRREGTERKDGVDLTRWMVTVPAEPANEHFSPGWPGMAIDCAEGFSLTAWTDGEGRLRRVRLFTEDFNGDTWDGDFALADFGKSPGDEAAPPRRETILGWREPEERARAKAEFEAAVARGERRPKEEPTPCASTDVKPVGVDRSDCTPTSLKGFEMLDRRGRSTPGAKAEVHFRFMQMTPAPEAFVVPDGLTVVRFGTHYTGPDGWELTRYGDHPLAPDFDPSDQAAIEAMLSRPEHGETAPAGIGLDTIVLEGTWAALAAEGSNCRYRGASS